MVFLNVFLSKISKKSHFHWLHHLKKQILKNPRINLIHLCKTKANGRVST